MGVRIVSHHSLVSGGYAQVTYACGFTGKETVVADCSLLMVTARLPHNGLGRELAERRDAWNEAGIKSVTLIGNALAPGTIAAAVWAGRRYAEEFDEEAGPIAKDMRREVTRHSAGPFYWDRAPA